MARVSVLIDSLAKGYAKPLVQYHKTDCRNLNCLTIPEAYGICWDIIIIIFNTVNRSDNLNVRR